MNVRKCKLCGKEAVYLMQYIGSDEPSFYFPGSHIRGFSTTPVCEDCAEKQRQAARQQPAQVPA